MRTGPHQALHKYCLACPQAVLHNLQARERQRPQHSMARVEQLKHERHHPALAALLKLMTSCCCRNLVCRCSCPRCMSCRAHCKREIRASKTLASPSRRWDRAHCTPLRPRLRHVPHGCRRQGAAHATQARAAGRAAHVRRRTRPAAVERQRRLRLPLAPLGHARRSTSARPRGLQDGIGEGRGFYGEGQQL